MIRRLTVAIYLCFVAIYLPFVLSCAKVKDNGIRCGYRNVTFPVARIIGGRPARLGEFPWMVDIRVYMHDKYSHFCGGALIHPEWVLTAGHCILWVYKEDFQIIAGSNFPEYGITRNVKEAYTHRLYSKCLKEHDIGLIHLERPFKIDGTSINTVCLPSPGSSNFNSVCTISGWGNLDNDSDMKPTEELYTTDVRVFDDRFCNRLLASYICYNMKNMICAGNLLVGRDSCLGDSGSPLICKRQDGSFEVAGIVSKGVNKTCGDPRFPGIYTRVEYYLNWINNVINGNLEEVVTRQDPQNAPAPTTLASSSCSC